VFNIELITVAHKDVSGMTAACLERLRLVQRNFTFHWIVFSGDALLERARSQAASKFLWSDEAPYMLFLDDDIVFTPQDVARIYQDLIDGYDLIGGAYSVRDGTQLASYPFGGKMVLGEGKDENTFLDGGIHEVEYLSTGFMGISRKLLIKLRDELPLPLLHPNDWAKCYPFFESGRLSERQEPIYISEDWDFCEKARKVGIKTYIDTSVQVGHQGRIVYYPKDIFEKRMAAYAQEKVFGPRIKQQQQLEHIDTDIAEFLKIPLESVKDRINNGRANLAKAWKSHKGQAIDFYQDNVEALFDAILFNKQDYYYTDRLAQLINLSGLKVLDIGSGIGTLGFMLADEGNQVIGWEMNKPAYEFSKFRKEKYNMGAEFVSEMPIQLDEFDLVTAVDVFEHIEDLKDFIMKLGSGMKSGAKLYSSCVFGYFDESPMHFDHSANFFEWLKQAGFALWDSRWAVKF